MKVRVLAFASAGDALGSSEIDLDLPEGSNVTDLRAHLDRLSPAIRPLWGKLAIALDGELAGDEATLGEGSEVALLPPVSGGCPEVATNPAPAPALAVRLVEGPLETAACIDAVTRPGNGAVLIFVGTVRDRNLGRQVERITYSAYRTMAEERLWKVVGDLQEASPGLRVAIAHRLGDVAVMEASVVIAVSSPHREESYEASRQALERLKREVPIWKREHYRDGSAAWREEEALTR